MKYVRRLLACVIALAVLIGLAPWVLYAVGLSNIMGRPVAPVVRPSSAEAAVKPISPWGYVVSLASADPHAFDSETAAAWVVARRYNDSHLKTRKTMWWHLSGAALTIWLTRNWTSDQVIAAAAKVAD